VPYAEVEGWYADPFGTHVARWFSDGTPTALVRDVGGVTSLDEPPSLTYTGELELAEDSLANRKVDEGDPDLPEEDRTRERIEEIFVSGSD
jgi:hypothetical protein